MDLIYLFALLAFFAATAALAVAPGLTPFTADESTSKITGQFLPADLAADEVDNFESAPVKQPSIQGVN